MKIGLESSGFRYGRYNLNKKVYRIFSEPNYKDFTIKLLDEFNNPFSVSLCDVKIRKNK